MYKSTTTLWLRLEPGFKIFHRVTPIRTSSAIRMGLSEWIQWRNKWYDVFFFSQSFHFRSNVSALLCILTKKLPNQRQHTYDCSARTSLILTRAKLEPKSGPYSQNRKFRARARLESGSTWFEPFEIRAFMARIGALTAPSSVFHMCLVKWCPPVGLVKWCPSPHFRPNIPLFFVAPSALASFSAFLCAFWDTDIVFGITEPFSRYQTRPKTVHSTLIYLT